MYYCYDYFECVSAYSISNPSYVLYSMVLWRSTYLHVEEVLRSSGIDIFYDLHNTSSINLKCQSHASHMT